MVNEQLINPKSIVVVGASNDIQKPGGKILKNLLDNNFAGDLYAVNIKESLVQGIKSFSNPEDLPDVDLAIFAIAAKYTLQAVELLASKKNTKAFIIISAGFGEESHEGKILEEKIVETVNKYDACVIGPNCIGVISPSHTSVFTLPIPQLDPFGCDFISGSGATACFILEAGIPKGLKFSSVYSVGNSAQIGVEEVLEYMDNNFDASKHSKVKLLYIENLAKPQKFLKHTTSLIQKGCKIAAVKAGSSDAGSRAASSHTGALASSDSAVDALFKKAGVVRCYGREDLISVASIFMLPELKGKNIAVITHAGGPAVMLTDSLSKGGLEVPSIDNKDADELLEKLYPGSSVSNPIDFLATGTADQLSTIIDYVDQKFDMIDGMVVIFGTPGLSPIYDVYEVLDQKMRSSKKPIYPVLPSVLTASGEIDSFIQKGHVFFPDEVLLGDALARVYQNKAPETIVFTPDSAILARAKQIISDQSNGYLPPAKLMEILDLFEVPRAIEKETDQITIALESAIEIGFPLVMKVVGPVHKSDVGGVRLNINSIEEVKTNFSELMAIDGATHVLMQPMLSGTEIFIGSKLEDSFGHMVLFGLGGIYIEVLKDVRTLLAPFSRESISSSVKELKTYKLLEGVRGQEGVNVEAFIDVIEKIGIMISYLPEIAEMDLNPLLGNAKGVVAVDARIRIEHP